MARKFKKNASLPILILPGYGRVHDADVLEGDQYARFVPHYLYEITVDSGAKYPLHSITVGKLPPLPPAIPSEPPAPNEAPQSAPPPPPPPPPPPVPSTPPAVSPLREELAQPTNSLLLDVLDAENAKLELLAKEAEKRVADAQAQMQEEAKTAKKAPKQKKSKPTPKAAASKPAAASADSAGSESIPAPKRRGRPRKQTAVTSSTESPAAPEQDTSAQSSD